MKRIPLTRGKFALVDDADFEWLSKIRWHTQHRRGLWYALAARRNKQAMHRILLDAPDGMDVDHINGDGLDNRRSNLRLATRSQNRANGKLPNTNTSGYRGAYFHKGTKKWCSQIRINGKDIWLGLFASAKEAHAAYIEAAKKHFGEFARKE